MVNTILPELVLSDGDFSVASSADAKNLDDHAADEIGVPSPIMFLRGTEKLCGLVVSRELSPSTKSSNPNP